MERKMAVEEYKNINNLEKKSINTIKKYIHDLNELCSFLEKPVKKDTLLKWKEQLLIVFTLSSVNFMLANINNLFDICGHIDKKVQTCAAYGIDLEQLAETIYYLYGYQRY